METGNYQANTQAKRDKAKFRPKSLLSCLGKTTEKMVLTRLQWQVGKLHPNIYAYTNNKGTTDCLTNMLTSIKGRKATVIFMDLEKSL